jgi:hypothetical protein
MTGGKYTAFAVVLIVLLFALNSCKTDGGGSSPGDSINNPLALPKKTGVLNAAAWTSILSEINNGRRFVTLDLSECTKGTTGYGLDSAGVFDPHSAPYAIDGLEYIVNLILPEEAESIVWSSQIKHFKSLRVIRGENITKIGKEAFIGCTNLILADFPKVLDIEEGAFSNCIALEAAEYPEATSIGDSAFFGCTKMKRIILISATTVGETAFQDCSSLITARFPKPTVISESAFQGCTALISADFPEAATIKKNAFKGCTALEKVNLPKAATFEDLVFSDTGSRALTITLGVSTPPALGVNMFGGITQAKIVNLKLPNAAYDPIPPTDNNAGEWGNGLRGKGWSSSGIGSGTLNDKIALVKLP